MRFQVLLLLFAISTTLLAREYAYYPGSSLHLGSGFDKTDLSQTKQDCLEETELKRLDGTGAYESSFEMALVKSKQELFERTGFSAQVAVQSFFLSGGASVAMMDSVNFSNNDLHLMIMAKVNFGRVALAALKLKPQYQELLNQKQHEEFATLCGTEFVSAEVRGASVFALYTLHQMSKETMHQLETALSVSASFGTWSGSAKAAFENLTKQMQSSEQISVKVFAAGGTGIQDISGIVGNNKNIEHVQVVLENYVKNLTFERAVPLRFQTSQMSIFGYNETFSWGSLLGKDTLKGYFFFISDLMEKRDRL